MPPDLNGFLRRQLVATRRDVRGLENWLKRAIGKSNRKESRRAKSRT
jgi:hypothetical protein